MAVQSNLFLGNENQAALSTLEGLRYEPEFISQTYEGSLLEHVRELPFREFEFHGYLGKRRIVSFGWRYEYSGGGSLKEAEDLPDFILDLRSRAASFAHLKPEALQQVLITEYCPGAGIGWHRDKPVFEKVVGISLLAPCVLRFRRKIEGKPKRAWERENLVAQPRSAYLLQGPVRQEWQHSILRVDELRYSITFRSLQQE